MKLHLMSKFLPLLQQNRQNLSGVLASLFSPKTLVPSPCSCSSSPSSSNSLYERIQIIRDPKGSVVPVLEQWISERRTVRQSQLRYLVRTMKDFKRYNHALQISQWMTDRLYLQLSATDVALRLDLIYRVQGIGHAESYFNAISNKLKAYNVYGALLRAYVQDKSVEKAEAIMQKMKESGLVTSSFPYNMLINLYSQTGDFDKIEILIQKMEEKGIPQDKYTLRNRMASCVSASDICSMEKVLNLMEEDPYFVIDWRTYSIAADGFIKVGLIEKALPMLKKIEEMVPFQRTKLALEFLITFYTRCGMKDELYRVWNMHKSSDQQKDAPYACMITSLAKLDDLDGAEKIFDEWQSCCTMYDFRVLNKLIDAYCRKGLLEKAESAVNKAVVEGRMPYASTWHVLALGYTEHSQMPKAVEMLKRAIAIGRQGWWPNSDTLNASLDYLEGQGDIDSVEDMIMLLKKLGPFTRDIYHRWLNTRVVAGGSVSEVLDQMKMDGFSADEETHKILERRPNF